MPPQNHVNLPSATLAKRIQQAFESMSFHSGIDIVDTLRDVRIESLGTDGSLCAVGYTFGSSRGEGIQDDSFRISVHCALNPHGEVVSATAYECRKGQMVATL